MFAAQRIDHDGVDILDLLRPLAGQQQIPGGVVFDLRASVRADQKTLGGAPKNVAGSEGRIAILRPLYPWPAGLVFEAPRRHEDR